MDIPNLIEKKKEVRRTIPLLNVIFILLLIGGSILVGFFVGKRQVNDTGTVLGVKKEDDQKKVEENNSFSTLGKVLGVMTNGVGTSLQNSVKQISSVITDTASKSAENVTDAFFDSTVGTVLKQIDKLPEKQQEDIKRNICK